MAAEFITRKSLPRRTFLKGAGATLALPLLDAMTPAFARGLEAPRRFVAVCATLGFHTPFLFPDKSGRDFKMTPYLETLATHRDQFTVISGMSHPDQSGANGHTSELTWLTSARRPGLAGFKNTVSIDQVIAAEVGRKTRFPYLALTTNSESLSWTANGVPIPGESSPSQVFRQLFVDGTPSEVRDQVRGLKRGRSVLDAVAGEAKKLERSLGPNDRHKLDEYLTAVRGLEQQLGESEAWVNKPKPKVDVPPPTDIANRNDAIGRVKLMYALTALALRTDSTRVVTLRVAGMNAVPLIDGVSNDWHNLSHHGQDAEKIDELKRIELAEFRAFGEFLGQLKSAESGGTVLDRTAVVFGSNLGNASSHDWRNLPLVLAGGGFRHGQHLAFDRKNNVPFCNLFVAVARQTGVKIDKFGSSTAAGVTGLDAA